MSGDLRMFDLNSCPITKGNDSTPNPIIQNMWVESSALVPI
jgi:hypothetical protein